MCSIIFRQLRTKVRCTNVNSPYIVLNWCIGIWVKHLKTKTELHQNVIDKCLKSLLQKQLIKAIKNVKVRSGAYLRCRRVS